MNDTDFTICPFIHNELRFLTYRDFLRNCKILKFNFKNLDKNAKIFYKWYVYANIHIDEYGKNAIWNYLNSDDDDVYKHLFDLKGRYKTN